MALVTNTIIIVETNAIEFFKIDQALETVRVQQVTIFARKRQLNFFEVG